MHGNLGQLTLKNEEGKEELQQGWKPFSLLPLPPSLKPAGMLLGLDIPNPTCPHCSAGSSITGFPELAYLGLFDLIVEASKLARCLAGRESSLMLRVGEVEQASVERLNNCINIGGSPRTHAYTAEGGGWG